MLSWYADVVTLLIQFSWGLLTASGKPRPAYNTLKAIYQNYSKIVEPAPLERLAGTQPELSVPVHPDLATA